MGTIILALIAFFAAYAAFRQLQTYKLFEILKFLERPEFRAARRIVLREIYPRKDVDWWLDPQNGDQWEGSGSEVCASYDILARMIEYDRLGPFRPNYGSFFRRYWARSIIQNHDALERFLVHRRKSYPEMYSAFTDIAVSAKNEVGTMASPN